MWTLCFHTQGQRSYAYQWLWCHRAKYLWSKKILYTSESLYTLKNGQFKVIILTHNLTEKSRSIINTIDNAECHQSCSGVQTFFRHFPEGMCLRMPRQRCFWNVSSQAPSYIPGKCVSESMWEYNNDNSNMWWIHIKDSNGNVNLKRCQCALNKNICFPPPQCSAQALPLTWMFWTIKSERQIPENIQSQFSRHFPEFMSENSLDDVQIMTYSTWFCYSYDSSVCW